MGAQSFSTGPVDAWVGIGSLNPTPGVPTEPVFLGHSEDGFRVQVRPQWENQYQDVAGSKTPFDRIYLGSDAIITGVLSRWDEKVYAALGAYVDPSGAYFGQGAVRGTDAFDDRGTLALAEGAAFEVWFRYPRSSVPGALGGGILGLVADFLRVLPKGYHFLNCTMEGPDDLRPGAKPYKIGLALYALSEYTPITGTFVLYDHDMSAIDGRKFQ